jgi:hypothetical protein
MYYSVVPLQRGPSVELVPVSRYLCDLQSTMFANAALAFSVAVLAAVAPGRATAWSVRHSPPARIGHRSVAQGTSHDDAPAFTTTTAVAPERIGTPSSAGLRARRMAASARAAQEYSSLQRRRWLLAGLSAAGGGSVYAWTHGGARRGSSEAVALLRELAASSPPLSVALRSGRPTVVDFFAEWYYTMSLPLNIQVRTSPLILNSSAPPHTPPGAWTVEQWRRKWRPSKKSTTGASTSCL